MFFSWGGGYFRIFCREINLGSETCELKFYNEYINRFVKVVFWSFGLNCAGGELDLSEILTFFKDKAINNIEYWLGDFCDM